MSELPSDVHTSDVRFDEAGLVPCIAQDALTGEVRMVAFMNAEALRLTLATGEVHFFSRSRQKLWKKGESSGHVLQLRQLRLDCDGDALLALVEPMGPTCHTGARSCFSRVAATDDSAGGASAGWVEATAPTPFMDQLEATLIARKTATSEQSYTRKLLDGGATRVGEKLREEADELARAVAAESESRVASEAADLVYHAMVGLISRAVPWRSVLAELSRRFGTSGHAEKASRGREPADS